MTEPVLVSQHSARLSLAVLPVDAFTGGRPAGAFEVTLDEKKGVPNPVGYYLFMDLAAGSRTLKITSDYFLEAEQSVTLPLAGEPAIEVSLTPGPSYPFPHGATLVRGMIRDDDDEEPVAGATVLAIGKGIQTETTTKGEFVLYFRNLTEDDIIESGGKKYVKGNGNNNNVRIRATHPDYKNKTETIEAEEGKTASLTIEIRKKGG